MPYKTFVEVGRVCTVTYGPLVDRCVAVVDFIDDKRVMVDVLNADEPRQAISVKRIEPVDILLPGLAKGADPAAVRHIADENGVLKKWEEIPDVRARLIQQAKLSMDDFTRFKHQKLVEQRDKLLKRYAQ